MVEGPRDAGHNERTYVCTAGRTDSRVRPHLERVRRRRHQQPGPIIVGARGGPGGAHDRADVGRGRGTQAPIHLPLRGVGLDRRQRRRTDDRRYQRDLTGLHHQRSIARVHDSLAGAGRERHLHLQSIRRRKCDRASPRFGYRDRDGRGGTGVPDCSDAERNGSEHHAVHWRATAGRRSGNRRADGHGEGCRRRHHRRTRKLHDAHHTERRRSDRPDLALHKHDHRAVCDAGHDQLRRRSGCQRDDHRQCRRCDAGLGRVRTDGRRPQSLCQRVW